MEPLIFVTPEIPAGKPTHSAGPDVTPPPLTGSGLQTICLYCASSIGASPIFAEATRAMVGAIHAQGLGIVYGGGSTGLMGVVADSMLALGGECVGVMPRALVEKEVAHRMLTRLEVTEDMHSRKARLIALGSALVALPGGVGTLEEIIEAFVWLQLGYHRKPVGILNVASYFDPFLTFLRHACTAGFMKAEYLDLLIVESEPFRLLERLRAFEPPNFEKWNRAPPAPPA